MYHGLIWRSHNDTFRKGKQSSLVYGETCATSLDAKKRGRPFTALASYVSGNYPCETRIRLQTQSNSAYN